MIIYSIIKKSELEGSQRLDAEYYQPEYLRWNEKIKKNKYARFGELINILTDYTANGSFAGLNTNVNVSDEYGFAKWIRIRNLDEADFKNGMRFVDKKAFDFLKKTSLVGGELLISKTGEYLGRAYLMPKIKEKATLADNIFLIRLKDESLKEYIYVFINSNIGRSLLVRSFQGTGQPTIIKDSLRDCLIPIPSEDFKNLIKKYYEDYIENLNNSNYFYSQAENLFLENIGVKKDTEKHQILFNTVNFSEIKKSNRMDAEYFQLGPFKFGELISVTDYTFHRLSDLVTLKKGIEPGAEAYQEEGKLFVRVSSISKDGITDKDQKYLKDDLYQKLKKDYQPKTGEILLTKDASPGMAYVVKEPIDGIVSGGVLRLSVKEGIEPEYIALAINSSFGQMQVERDSGGSIIKHWKPDQVKEMQIPILSKPIQQKIAELVQKSHESRKKAKELLEEAKRKVEELIENN